MKLAFFTSIVPDGNPSTGFEIANEAIVSRLRELGHAVTVFGFQLPRQSVAAHEDVVVLDVRELENSTAGMPRKLQWLSRAFVSGLPLAAAKLVDFSASQLDDSIVDAGPLDGHILNSYQMAAAFPLLRNSPYIYVAHNVEHQSALHNAEESSSAIESFLYRRDARLLRSIEEKLCNEARFVWTFSDDDLGGHNIKSAKGTALPLFVPEQVSTDAAVEKIYDVGLIGTWSWQANSAGLRWFVESVVPQLPGSISVAVAGSVPNDVRLQDARINYLGRVESASQFLQSVRVIPLVSRGGTGVQLKTIEAFQAGHACVATESSLRGIDHLPKNCLRADDPEAFARCVSELVERDKFGQLPHVDGSQFLDSQKLALTEGLKRGLAALA